MIFKMFVKSNFLDLNVPESVYVKYPNFSVTSVPIGIQNKDGKFSTISILFRTLNPRFFLFFRLTQVEKNKIRKLS